MLEITLMYRWRGTVSGCKSHTTSTRWVTMLQPCEDNRIVPPRNRLGDDGDQGRRMG